MQLKVTENSCGTTMVLIGYLTRQMSSRRRQLGRSDGWTGLRRLITPIPYSFEPSLTPFWAAICLATRMFTNVLRIFTSREYRRFEVGNRGFDPWPSTGLSAMGMRSLGH